MAKMEEFVTGAHRGSQEGKVRYDLIPRWFLRRFAQHLGNGSQIYEAWNWCGGMPVKRTQASVERHLEGLVAGKRDEDHCAALAFNAMVLEHTLVHIKNGTLPESLLDGIQYDDLPVVPDYPIEFKHVQTT